MKYFLKWFFLFMLVTAVSADTSFIRIGSFAESGLEGWSEKSFKGKTAYRIVEDAGLKVLQAKSEGSASGLVFEIEYDAEDYPILSWRWKVANIIARGDSRIKAGDDYAARVYVVFPHWFFPKTRTLNYIWANRLTKEAVQANAYLSSAVMIAVESGAEHVGEWRAERRNIVDDYRRAFGEDPPAIGAIAIMTDTDNTGESAIAWYAEIVASRQ
ncbi:MAG: DUF3047 domain-containing protein [Desulfuromonadales bacterium]